MAPLGRRTAQQEVVEGSADGVYDGLGGPYGPLDHAVDGLDDVVEGVEDPLHGLRAELHAAGGLCDALDGLLGGVGVVVGHDLDEGSVGGSGPLCGLIVGDRHAAVVGVEVGLVLRAIDQPLAEGKAGLGRLLPGRFYVGPGLHEGVIVGEGIGAPLVVPADAGGDVVDGHVAEVAEVVAVQGHGPGVETQGLESVVDVVGLPLVVAEVAPDGQGVPRAAGAVDNHPADPVADLAGVLPGDFFQCCHAGASSLMMRTTVTRSSMSCLVM